MLKTGLFIGVALCATLLGTAAFAPADPPPGFTVVGIDGTPNGATLIGIAFAGAMTRETGDDLKKLAMDRIAMGQVIAYYKFTSNGGLGFADLVDALRWDDKALIYVDHDCLSACGLAVLLAGPKRLVLGPNARIGLHQARDVATDKPMVMETREYGVMLQKVGVPKRVANRMVKTPPSGMYYVDQDDLMAMNVQGRYVKSRVAKR